jgi:hypothetical protein
VARRLLAERLGVSVAASASVALLVYALLQIAGAGGRLAAPRGVIPLFWRLKIAAGTGALAALAFAQLGGLGPARRRRLLHALLVSAIGAIAVCTVFWP